jgi:hypothetical protein
VVDAMNDFACRFTSLTPSTNACTLNQFNDFAFVNPDSSVQYCTAPAVGAPIAFPSGTRTRLTVEVSDTNGNVGDRASIVVEVLMLPLLEAE